MADLMTLPPRLTDAQLAACRTVADEPLPPPVECSQAHLARCLRVMLAVLPRAATDAVGGELFVRAYERHLLEWPQQAISYLAERATRDCRWFPTIVECRDILAQWHRDDEHTRQRALASAAIGRELAARRAENPPPEPEYMPITQDLVDAMAEPLRRIGLAGGWLVQDDDGAIRPAEDAA